MKDVGLPPLPAVLQADGDLPGRRRRRGAAATGRSCSSAARPTNPLFGAFFQAAQEAGYPLTDDVNGYRQEGFARFDRNVHRGRRLSAARAYLHPVRDRKNLTVETYRVRHQGPVPGQARGRGRLPARRPAAPQRRCRPGGPVRRRDQHPAAAAALRRRRRGAAQVARHRRRAPPSRRGREPPGPPRGLHPVRLEAAGLDRPRPALAGPAQDRLRVAVPPQRPRRHQPLRGRRLRPQQRGRRLPEPDVPLPPGRDPVRRVVADRRATATRCTSARCTPTPAAGCGSGRGTRRCTRRCSSTTCRRRPTARSGWRRSGSPGTSSTSRRSRRTTTASSRPAPRSRPTSRSWTGCARTPRPPCTRRARRRWASTRCRSSTRRRWGCTASRGSPSSTPRSSRSSPTATSTRR